MIIGIMQPYFFPYLGYWQLINLSDRYVVYDDVTYIKGGWISRNNILLNNQAHMLTLPLDKPSSFRNINEIEITKDDKARHKVLKTIEAAYKKAPNFCRIYSEVERLILGSRKISELNYNAILKIAEYLEMNTEILLSSELIKDNSVSGQDKVIEINKILGGNMYVNSGGGKSLYSKDVFDKNGLELRFLEMDPVEYKQFGKEFVPNLSIVDILMFCSVDQVKELLSKYTLTLE